LLKIAKTSPNSGQFCAVKARAASFRVHRVEKRHMDKHAKNIASMWQTSCGDKK